MKLTELSALVGYFDYVKRAWQQVKQNHGAPGVDRMTIEEAREIGPQWRSLIAQGA